MDVDTGGIKCIGCNAMVCSIANTNFRRAVSEHACPPAAAATSTGPPKAAKKPNIGLSLMKAGAKVVSSSAVIAGARPHQVQCMGFRQRLILLSGVGETAVQVSTDFLMIEPHLMDSNGSPMVLVQPHAPLALEIHDADQLTEALEAHRERGAVFIPNCNGRTWVATEKGQAVAVCSGCRKIPRMVAVQQAAKATLTEFDPATSRLNYPYRSHDQLLATCHHKDKKVNRTAV